jgi:hypothetical protein
MGVVAGGVAMRDGLLPAFAPWPGVDDVAVPRAWYDSVEVVVGEDAGWRGFSGSLVELRAFAEPTRSRKPRAAFTLVNGSSALDRTGLFLQRGGDDSWLRGGAFTEERSGAGRLENRGDHVWFVDLGFRRGAHTYAGAFSQRGAAGATRRELVDRSTIPPYLGFEETARGEAGSLRWTWEEADRQLKATLARSHDHRESSEQEFQNALGVFAERESQQNSLELEASRGSADRGHGARLELTKAQVGTSEDFFGPRPAIDTGQRTAWLAVRDRRLIAGGRLELQLGAGYNRAAERRAERFQLAPSLVWRRESGGQRWRAHAGRYVTPVWSDLALGERPFVQDTWMAGGGWALGSERSAWLDVSGMVAETGNRALLQRWAVRHIALRNGWTREPVRVQDALVQGAAGARWRAFVVDALAWSRVRPQGTQVARVDPAVGGRAGLESRFSVFAGDLGVRLRVATAWVGDRETEPLTGYSTPPQPVPGYFTSSASAGFTIGDAEITVRAYNLEDVAQPQVWIDPTSPFPGTPALGSGRQFRVELAWPLFN